MQHCLSMHSQQAPMHTPHHKYPCTDSQPHTWQACSALTGPTAPSSSPLWLSTVEVFQWEYIEGGSTQQLNSDSQSSQQWPLAPSSLSYCQGDTRTPESAGPLQQLLQIPSTVQLISPSDPSPNPLVPLTVGASLVPSTARSSCGLTLEAHTPALLPVHVAYLQQVLLVQGPASPHTPT